MWQSHKSRFLGSTSSFWQLCWLFGQWLQQERERQSGRNDHGTECNLRNPVPSGTLTLYAPCLSWMTSNLPSTTHNQPMAIRNMQAVNSVSHQQSFCLSWEATGTICSEAERPGVWRGLCMWAHPRPAGSLVRYSWSLATRWTSTSLGLGH